MKHGHISRNYAKAFFAFAALALVGACAEQTTVAPAEQAEVIAPANFSRVGNTVVFRVNNSSGITKKIGSHVINIPAGAICELTATYGTTEWDKSCNPLSGSVVITATIMQDNNAQPYIDFQPALRFTPGKEVMLFLRAADNSGKTEMVVKYCNAVAYCYDESLTDPSLKPFRIGQTSIIGRRIKHFSGYMIGSGRSCENDGSEVCGDMGLARRSGYMVASGEDVANVMGDEVDDKTGKKQNEQ